MKKQSNYNELILLRNEINQFAQSSISFRFFFNEKIKNFFSRNAMNLKIAEERMIRLTDAYIQHTEEESKRKPVTKLNEETGQQEYVFISDEAKHKFDKEYKEFVNRHITIEC